VLRLRHAKRIAADLGSYARMNRAWWLVAVVGGLAIAMAAGTASQTAVPFAVYTLF
jgi:hypothetical protein